MQEWTLTKVRRLCLHSIACCGSLLSKNQLSSSCNCYENIRGTVWITMLENADMVYWELQQWCWLEDSCKVRHESWSVMLSKENVFFSTLKIYSLNFPFLFQFIKISFHFSFPLQLKKYAFPFNYFVINITSITSWKWNF